MNPSPMHYNNGGGSKNASLNNTANRNNGYKPANTHSKINGTSVGPAGHNNIPHSKS